MHWQHDRWVSWQNIFPPKNAVVGLTQTFSLRRGYSRRINIPCIQHRHTHTHTHTLVTTPHKHIQLACLILFKLRSPDFLQVCYSHWINFVSLFSSGRFEAPVTPRWTSRRCLRTGNISFSSASAMYFRLHMDMCHVLAYSWDFPTPQHACTHQVCVRIHARRTHSITGWNAHTHARRYDSAHACTQIIHTCTLLSWNNVFVACLRLFIDVVVSCPNNTPMYTAFARTHALTHANMLCITNLSIIYTSDCNLFVLFQWPLPFLSYTRARILTYTRTHFTRSYICICTLPAYTCTHTRCTRCCIHIYTHTRCTLSLFTHILMHAET